jgi:glycosyltransferase involved in cell wall biosynthesis
MSTPRLVTTVIPVFNRAALLREAVDSVLAQTYRPIEIVIVDDGSTDDTAAVADELARAHAEIIRVIHQQNGGVGAAREAGRVAARGEFLQYLDSDDLLLPSRFERLVAALDAHPDCGIAYGRTRYRDEEGREIECTWKPLLAGEETIFPHFLRGRLWETVSALHRTNVTNEAGAWLPLSLEEDWEYDCRFGALGTRLVFVDETLTEHRAFPERLSAGDALEPRRLRDRAAAESHIFAHAQRANISNDTPELQHFARNLFRLSRQCGAAGLRQESREILTLAIRASAPMNRQLRAYAFLAGATGWTTLGKLSVAADKLRDTRRRE